MTFLADTEIDLAANIRRSSLLVGTDMREEWSKITLHMPNPRQVDAWCARLNEEEHLLREMRNDGTGYLLQHYHDHYASNYYANCINTFHNRMRLMHDAHRRSAYRGGQALLALKYACDAIEGLRYRIDRTERKWNSAVTHEMSIPL